MFGGRLLSHVAFVGAFVVLVATPGLAQGTASPADSGDLNCDGSSVLRDAQLVAQGLASTATAVTDCTGLGADQYNSLHCDVDGDAICNPGDSTLILECLIELVDQPCVEQALGPCPGTVAWGIFGDDLALPTINIVDATDGLAGVDLFHEAVPDATTRYVPIAEEVALSLYASSSDVPPFSRIDVTLVDDPNGVASNQSSNGVMTIRVSAQYLENVYAGSGNSLDALRYEIDGVMYHEIVHGYQKSPLASVLAPGGLGFIEGIADAVRIAHGHHIYRGPDLTHADRWRAGYTTTGFFLHYMVTQYDNQFLRKFNATPDEFGLFDWSFESAFELVAGRSAEDAWDDYVAFVQAGGTLDYDGDYAWTRLCA